MNTIQQYVSRLYPESLEQAGIENLRPETEAMLQRLLCTQTVELLVDALPVAQQKLLDNADSLNFYCLDAWNEELKQALSQRWEKTLLAIIRETESTDDPS